MFKPSKCCIIGIPDDQGVIHVGGRVGASRGPAAFRQIFSKFRGKFLIPSQVRDLGDVASLSGDISANHREASHAVRDAHLQFPLSVVVGGGHDHGFSHLVGVSEALTRSRPRLRLGCLNIDAHLDVRKPNPWISSGSPFYLALESGVLAPKRFVEFGIQSHCNSPHLWEFIELKKVKVVPFQRLRCGKAIPTFKRELQKLATLCDAIVVSLDLDAAASAYSPGVSAPQSEGFTAMEIVEMAEISGAQKKVVSLGIFELNPEHDLQNASARLAATAAYHFIESTLFRKS